MKYKILVAEDDPDICELLKLYLENNGYEVYTAGDGEAAHELLSQMRFSLAVVDIMMPKMNGYDLIRRVRARSNIPILVLSAKNLDSDKILGLNIGADDYMVKPFNPLEVIARVNSNLRRFYHLGSDTQEAERKAEEQNVLRVKDLELNRNEVTLWKAGKKIDITPAEYKILLLLMQSPGKVFTKRQIYEQISGASYLDDDNTLMVHISNLREKLEDQVRTPEYIRTIRGIGYKLEK